MKEKLKVINEPAECPAATAVATELVENSLKRVPVVGLIAHFAGVLLGLFRRPGSRKARTGAHASIMHRSCIPDASLMHPKRPRPARGSRTGEEVRHG